MTSEILAAISGCGTERSVRPSELIKKKRCKNAEGRRYGRTLPQALDSGVPRGGGAYRRRRAVDFRLADRLLKGECRAKRPEVAPQNRIRDGEVIASKHVEMLVC